MSPERCLRIGRPSLPRRPIAVGTLGLAVAWLVQIAAAQEPVRGTRELLRLIPSDSGVVLSIDDLRGQVRELMATKLAAEFQRLPAVKAWFDSEKYEQLETARDQIEGMLQAKLTEIRDQVLGDAVVFAVRLPSDGPRPVDPSRAQGLLVLKARDPVLLKRLIDLINTIQKNNGELAAVVDRKRGENSYVVREFPPGSSRHADAYVTFADGTFAISNSEELIQQVIDRKTGKTRESAGHAAGPGIAAQFEALARQLPERALARLFVDARFAVSLLENAPPTGSRGEAIFKRYVRAHECAGAALVVCNGRLALEVAEVFERDKFHELLGSWTGGTKPTAAQLDHVPANTLLIASLEVDFAWLYRTVREFIPEAEKVRLTNSEIVLDGLLLGQNLRSRILPALGPRMLGLVEAPAVGEPKSDANPSPQSQWPFPTVIALELGPAPEAQSNTATSGPHRVSVVEALDNALNTLLALITFDHRLGQGRARIVTRQVAGVSVKTLEPPIPLAYAVDRMGHRLVLGSSSAVVERYLAAGSDPAAGSQFRRLRSRGFAGAHSFLCLDLAAVQDLIVKHRDRLTATLASRQQRSRQDVAHDVEQVLALSRLFDAAYLTNRIDANSATVFHTVGVLARQTDPESPSRNP